MKIDESKRNIFLKKKRKLNEARIQLKKEFIGINDIIDEVINIVESWWIFPKNNLRPTIINLWGLTGVGKSSLIKRLFELLNHSAFFKFDIGDYTSEGDSKMKYEFSKEINATNEESPVIVFDEFQLGRTINPDGSENDRSGLRLVWEVLDTGKILLYRNNWSLSQFLLYNMKMENFLENHDIKVVGGEVVGGEVDEFRREFGYPTEEEEKDRKKNNKDIDSNQPLNKQQEKEKLWFIPDSFLYRISSIREDEFLNMRSLRVHLNKMNIDESLKFINECIDLMTTPEIKDFSDSLIFVIGNLDEVYNNISSDISPDLDADFFSSHTKKITITEVKNSLLQRYRPEQISRLGNNHLIYPSIDKKSYEDIIKLELDKFIKSSFEKFNFEINFDYSVNDIIYKESVFPTQGVRPILSTIDNLIKSYIGRIINDIYVNQKDVNYIQWIFKDDEYNIEFYEKINNKLNYLYNKKYPVLIKTELKRRSTIDDSQALIGVHEAGHIITSIFSLNICPKCAFSRTANDNGGFTWIEFPEWKSIDYYKKYIKTLYGGYAAEQMIFGEDNLTNGASSDLCKLTTISQQMLVKYAMLDEVPSQFGIENSDHFLRKRMIDTKNKDEHVEKLLKECYKETKELLKKENKLLLKIGEYLMNNPKIEEHIIKDMVEKYSVSEIPIYKNKENFYDYKNILNKQISSIEEDKIREFDGNMVHLNIKNNQ